MEKHTPEIWHNTGLEIRNQAGMIIATVYKHLESNQSKEQAITNAALISRAPSLLEENNKLREALKLFWDESTGNFDAKSCGHKFNCVCAGNKTRELLYPLTDQTKS